MSYLKEEAYRRYRDGKMPEDWYRMNYATFEESFMEDLRRAPEKHQKLMEEYRQR